MGVVAGIGRLGAVLERNGWRLAQRLALRFEALDHVRPGVPRLILMDLRMRLMQGFAFLHRLRDLPVVVLSARDYDRMTALRRFLRDGWRFHCVSHKTPAPSIFLQLWGCAAGTRVMPRMRSNLV